MKCSSIFEIKTEMKSLVTHDYQTNSIALIKNTVHKMKNLSVKNWHTNLKAARIDHGVKEDRF